MKNSQSYSILQNRGGRRSESQDDSLLYKDDS